MSYSAYIHNSEEEIEYLYSYLDRNKLEMGLLLGAIDEIESILEQAEGWLTNEIAFAGVKSLKKKLEEELAEKALKSLEIKKEHTGLIKPDYDRS